MAFQAFISVKGAKQGQFKGEAAADKRRDRWIPVLSFSMGVKSLRDAATGHATGKRQWRELGVVKEWGGASPQALQACATNEKLPEVDIEFSKTNANGEEFVHQVVKLTDAEISEVDRHSTGGLASGSAGGGTSPADTQELERWSFTFSKIEVTDTQGKTAFQDNWMGSV